MYSTIRSKQKRAFNHNFLCNVSSKWNVLAKTRHPLGTKQNPSNGSFNWGISIPWERGRRGAGLFMERISEKYIVTWRSRSPWGSGLAPWRSRGCGWRWRRRGSCSARARPAPASSPATSPGRSERGAHSPGYAPWVASAPAALPLVSSAAAASWSLGNWCTAVEADSWVGDAGIGARS